MFYPPLENLYSNKDLVMKDKKESFQKFAQLMNRLN